jgi:tetratricopeptide (TPR) repeat protein
MKYKTILPSLLILLLVSGTIYAQIGPGVGVNSISGNVFNEERRPIGQSWVELATEYGNVVQRTQTNQSGHFTFMRIPYGKYIVKARAYGTGLEEQEKGVDLYNMSGDARRQMPMYEQVDFYLVRRRSASSFPEMTGVVFAQSVPKEARDIYDSVGLDDASDGAVSKLENAVRLFPKYHDALVRLGLLYLNNQKYAEAEPVFTTVVEVNPQGFSGWYGLGQAQYSLNNPAALTSMQKAIAINRNWMNAWFILGLAQRKSKNYDDSLKSLLQAKKLDEGKTSDINWNLALLYYHNLKKPIQAAEELEEFLKLNKDAKNKEQVRSLIKKFRSAKPYEGSSVSSK